MRDYSAIVTEITPSMMDAIKQEYGNGSAGFADRVRATFGPNISEEDLAILAAEFAEWPCYRGK